MNNENKLQALIDQIEIIEGDGFECEMEFIESEYQEDELNKSSLTIKALTILGGFFATIAFISFLLVAGLYDSENGLLFFGVIFIIGSIFINKMYNKLIIDTLSISVYSIGYILLGMGMSKLNLEENMISFVFITVAFSTLFFTRNYILAFISVLITMGSIISLLIINDSYNLIHLYNSAVSLLLTYLFINEARIITTYKNLSKLYDPIRIGLVFSFIMGLIFIGIRGLLPVSMNYLWISSLFNISLIMYLINNILDIVNVRTKKNKILIYTASIIILLLTTFSPAISGAILILLLCYLVNFKTGVAIGIISIIYFVSQYYYDLNFKLLEKSGILFAMGVIFILFYLFTSKNRKNEEI